MASISYFIKGTKDVKNIYVRLIDKPNAIDLQARTKWSVLEKNWSKKKSGINNPKEADLKNLQIDLNDFKNQLLNVFNLDAEKKDLDWLKQKINPNQNKEIKDVKYYLDLYIQNKSKDLSFMYKNAFRKLFLFADHKKIKQLMPIDVDNKFLTDFYSYSINTLNYAPNNVYRNIKFIKTVLYFAEFNGEAISKQLRKTKFKLDQNKPITLSFEELEVVKKIDLPEHLANAKDWLVISCYTGQRVSDFLRFDKSMLKQEKEKWFLEFMQTKTKKKMFLPLHKEVVELLQKNDFNFPRKIADQNYNQHIKEVCRLAGLTEPIEGAKMDGNRKAKGTYPKYELISSHVGRRSFATNFYGIIPTNLIMIATGHSTENMLLTYIGKTDRQQSYALAEYF